MTRRAMGAVADSGPVLVLAAIAAAGSFTHIRDTATEHGQTGWMAWAIAVCIDLTCVMAAGERQRDKRTGRTTGRLSWPTLVLVGGILLSLAANLAQADPTVWGWITAGTPAGAFLVAVSMLERRKNTATLAERSAAPSPDVMTAPPPSDALTPNRPPPRRSRTGLVPNWPRPAPLRRTTTRTGTATRTRTDRPRSPSPPTRTTRPRPRPRLWPRLRRCLWWPSPAASPPNTRTGTDGRSPVTRYAPGSGSPTSSPPTSSARSAPKPPEHHTKGEPP